MDVQPLQNVLTLLRLVARQSSGQTASLITKLAGKDITPRSLLRILAYIHDQLDAATAIVAASPLVDEAKAGVFQGINMLRTMFDLGNLRTDLSAYSGQTPGYISNLVILLSSGGFSTETSTPQEADDLAREIDEFTVKFDDPQMDPVVAEIAKKHLIVLSTLLRHVNVFGLEPALSSYFELVMKLRRADSKSSEGSKSALDKLMVTVRTWGDRLSTIDGAITTGGNLLDRAKSAGSLLEYIPPLIA